MIRHENVQKNMDGKKMAKKFNYTSRWFGQPLYTGTKLQMQNLFKERKKTTGWSTKDHVIRKIPKIKGSRAKYGIYRKKKK